MNPSPKILVCDHRGTGLADRLEALSAAGYATLVSRHLRSSLEALAGEPVTISFDPACCHVFAPDGSRLSRRDETAGREPV